MRKIRTQLPPVSEETRARAAELRKQMTDAERILWAQLKNRKLGMRFQRQRPLGPYICDFLSIEAGLVIELDGSQHYGETGKDRDARKNVYLEALGFQVLRFSNLDVKKNLAGVMAVIGEQVPPL